MKNRTGSLSLGEAAPASQRVLQALKKAREQHGELASLLDFYHDLYAVQFRAKAALPPPPVRDEAAMRWRLEGGVPQLSFDQLRLVPEPFARLTAQLADVLLRYNPDWQLDLDAAPADGLVALARRVFETWDTLTGPKTDNGAPENTPAATPLTLAVAAALAPYLQRAAETLYPHLDLSRWGKGYCPVCGGRPNFALLDEERGARRLMCSRCAALWGYSRLRCPFCDAGERAIYYASEDGFYRLYVCPACKHYVKTVDLRKARRVVEPMVERLLTVGMDLAARQEGYA